MTTQELLPNTEQAKPDQIHQYQEIVGSANYAATQTRPDIAKTISKLSTYLTNPSREHRAAADRLLEYLNGTQTLGIEYSGDLNKEVFLASCDAAFGDNADTRRSSDGYLFQLYGGPIDWRASRQKTVTTSSTEAELLSTSVAAKEIVWWGRFFEAIQFDIQQKSTLKCDNLQTVRILTTDEGRLTTKLRHIDIHQMWLRQAVQQGTIHLQWIPTADMPADGLTKALPKQKHLNFIKQLNLVDRQKVQE
jgi:hypothetical protein